MPAFAGVSNLLDQPIYDTMQLAAVAAQDINYFTVPFGGPLTAALNKTFEHTNLIQAGQLEKGNSLSITGLSMFGRVHAAGAAAGTNIILADALAIFTGWMELKVGQVSYLKLPLAMIPNGGAEPVLVGNGAAASTHLTHSVSAFSNRYHLKNQIMLEASEAVVIEAHFTATITAVTDVTFVLWGDYLRPLR